MSNQFAKQLARPAWLSGIVIFAALSGACGASDAGNDPFTGGVAGSTSSPGAAGRTGTAGSGGGPIVGTAGSGTGGNIALAGSGGSASSSGGAIGAGGFGSGTGGTNASGGSGGMQSHAGQPSGFGGSAGHGGQPSGSGGNAGHGGQSTGGAGGASPTWTEIYTKFLTNAQYASNCNGSNCHNPGKQKGFDFSTQANGYASVKGKTSQLVSELSSGAMPQGKTKMPAADLAVIKAWVAAGALNN